MAGLSYLRLRQQVDVLKEQLARWKTDEEFKRAGGTIHYAIDNDVLTLITAPWNTEYQRYLETFIEGDSDAVEATAYLFAEFFLKSGPYLIVSPGSMNLKDCGTRSTAKPATSKKTRQEMFVSSCPEQINHPILVMRSFLTCAKKS